MSALAKIKKSAAQHEQDRQYDKALAEYARLLDGGAGAEEEVDVALYNRAGDLALRAGDVPRAVQYFERAVDLYAAGGFLNNAVALAVKVLRHAPGHLAAQHTLGVLYARKGFRVDARQHFGNYAAQMHRAGRPQEVRRTMGELGALCDADSGAEATRELLTAIAAGPGEAGALVAAFDAARGVEPPTVGADDALQPARSEAAASADVTAPDLADVIDLAEAFGVQADVPAPVVIREPVRWTDALPGDPPLLRLAALRNAFVVVPPTPRHELSRLDEELLVDAGPLEAVEALDFDGWASGPPAVAPPVDFVLESDFIDSDDATGAGTGDVFSESILDSPGWIATPAATPTAAEFVDVSHDAPVDAVAQMPFVARAAAVDPAAEPARSDGDGLDLGAWLRAVDEPRSTRMVTPVAPATGDEAADFDAALQAFTAGVGRALDHGDRNSHYDLGIAFREMGLLSDAVRELQRASACADAGLREREALARCFLDLGRPALALQALERAATQAEGLDDGALVGVHYVLASAAAEVGRVEDARAWYVRVLAAEFAFADAQARLAALPPVPARAW